jgi:hypothetical protein
MDSVQKLSDFECYTPLSESVRFNGITSYLEFRKMDKVQKLSYSEGN